MGLFTYNIYHVYLDLLLCVCFLALKINSVLRSWAFAQKNKNSGKQKYTLFHRMLPLQLCSLRTSSHLSKNVRVMKWVELWISPIVKLPGNVTTSQLKFMITETFLNAAFLWTKKKKFCCIIKCATFWRRVYSSKESKLPCGKKRKSSWLKTTFREATLYVHE